MASGKGMQKNNSNSRKNSENEIIKQEKTEEKKFKIILNEEKYKGPKKNKMLKYSKSERIKIKPINFQDTENINNKQAAREKYREWLRSSLSSLKKLKSLEKLEKIKQEQIKKHREEEKKIKAEQANKAFQFWLEKKKQKKERNNNEVKKFPKLKKVLMLAYSLNKKMALSLSSIEETTVPEKTEQTSKNSNASSDIEKLEEPIFSPEYLKKYTPRKSEEYRAFDELSSIDKNPKLQSVFPYEEDVESLISDLERNGIA